MFFSYISSVPRLHLSCATAVNDVDFHICKSDSREIYIAAIIGKTLATWRVVGSQATQVFTASSVEDVRASPDGRFLAGRIRLASDALTESVYVWDLISKDSSANQFKVSADGELLWDSNSEWLLHRTNDDLTFWSASSRSVGERTFAANGACWAYLCPRRRLLTWDLDLEITTYTSAAACKRELKVGKCYPPSFDDRWLIVQTFDEASPSLRAYAMEGSISEARTLLTNVKGEWVRTEFSSDRSWVAVSTPEELYIWIIINSDFNLIKRYSDKTFSSLSISPDSQWLVAWCRGDRHVGDRCTLFRYDRGRSLVEIVDLNGHEDGVEDAVFGRTGRWLATRSCGGSVRLWDLKSNNVAKSAVLLPGTSSRLDAFSYNDEYLVGDWNWIIDPDLLCRKPIHRIMTL